MIHCTDFWKIRNLTLLSAGPAHFSNIHYDQWNPESYLSKHGRMKFLQYDTGCAVECSEVTKSTVYHISLMVCELCHYHVWLYDGL